MKKMISLLLALCLTLGMVSFAAAELDPHYAGIDLSTPETISIYFVGFECADWGRVNDLINEQMSEKINTTINFVHISFADFIANYNQYLTGGTDANIIYSMGPNNYSGYAAADAFKPLSEEFLKTYMPQTWENTDPALWENVKLNGTIFAVPANDTDNDQVGVGVSKNMLEKYGYTPEMITNLDELNEFVKKASEGEKGTGVYGINCQNTWPSDAVYLPYMTEAFDVGAGNVTWFMWKYNEHETFDINDLFWYADDEKFMEWALMMADYYASGVYSTDVASNSATLDDAIHAGSTIIVPGLMPIQTVNYAGYYEERGDELIFLNCMASSDAKFERSFIGQRAVFPATSENTERAAIVLDMLKNDPEIHNLIIGGIEGEHYILNDDGSRAAGPKAADYTWANRFYFATDDKDPGVQLPAYVQEYVNEFETRTYGGETFPLASFQYDSSKYDAEIAVLNSILSEYRFAFCLGLYGADTAAKVEEYRAMMHAAGIDDVLQDYKTQYAATLVK